MDHHEMQVRRLGLIHSPAAEEIAAKWINPRVKVARYSFGLV
jgi:hypothetical protein